MTLFSLQDPDLFRRQAYIAGVGVMPTTAQHWKSTIPQPGRFWVTIEEI
jgi:hypothetical protein